MPRPLPQPIRGPVRCSRAARLRCPRMSSRAARAARGMSALALGLLQLIRGPVRCSHAALLRCPRTPSAGMSALALGLLLVLAAAVRAEERSVALAVAEHGFTPPEIEAGAGGRPRPRGTKPAPGAREVERLRATRGRGVRARRG